jgi:hypothetical protein
MVFESCLSSAASTSSLTSLVTSVYLTEVLRGSGATLVLDIKPGALLDAERVVRLTGWHGQTPT